MQAVVLAPECCAPRAGDRRHQPERHRVPRGSQRRGTSSRAYWNGPADQTRNTCRAALTPETIRLDAARARHGLPAARAALPRLVGYARVSTAEPSLAPQQDALTAARCGRTFADVASGGAAERDGLTAALAAVRAGDTVVVWRLDRLGRSLARGAAQQSIERVTTLDVRKGGFRSLTEAIDTTTTGGKLVFHLLVGA